MLQRLQILDVMLFAGQSAVSQLGWPTSDHCLAAWHCSPSVCGPGRQNCQLLQVRSQSNCEKRLLASSCTSVCLSACRYEAPRLPLDGFPWNFLLGIFTKICRCILILVKIEQRNGHFTCRFTYISEISSPSVFITERVRAVCGIRFEAKDTLNYRNLNSRTWVTVNLAVYEIFYIYKLL